MKRRFYPIILTVCLCMTFQSVAYAYQEAPLLQEDAVSKELTFESVTSGSESPTPTQVYESMIALKEQDAYKEGTTWTNDEPYSASKGYYCWQGGTLGGTNIVAVGCVAFAFILSDAAFGNLPARMYAPDSFSYEDIKVGDILRLNTDTHTVIVLEVSDAGIVVAEGNISTGDQKGKIHWGRKISKEVVVRDVSHYITRYPEGYIPPDNPEANVSIAKGEFNGFTWNLTKAGMLTVSGKGAMPDFNSREGQPWNDNSGQIRKVVIGNGVTSIGDCAFWGCEVLSAEIPSSVTTIGSNAFRGSSIISVTIPSSVKTIGDSAFRECQSLGSVTFSEGLEKIVQNAFRACTSLTSVVLPASIKEVGAGTFFECTAMTKASFVPGNKQVKLGDNLFTQCYYLMSVTLPQNIDRISDGMFQNCQMLAGVEIPKGAESIGASAFASCSRFTTVVIPDSVTLIENAAFANCSLADIYFTGTQAQWDRINKGSNTQYMSKAVMYYNYIPGTKPDSGANDSTGNGNNNGSSSGGSSSGSSNSSNGNNPGSSSSSGGNNSGKDISQVPKQTPLAKGKTFTKNKITYKVTKAGAEVQLIKSKSTAKKITVNTVTGTDGVKYKVTAIGSKAMQNNKKMTGLTIGTNVKKIGANAFSGCKKLSKVTIKSTKLSSVGEKAFKGTKSKLKVKVPSKQLKKYRKLLKKAGLKNKQITK